MLKPLLVTLLALFVTPAMAVSVLDYGAIPNDALSDTAAFQAAQNAVAASGVPGELYIPCGRYRITSPVLFGNEGFRIRGQNTGCTQIFVAASTTAFVANVTIEVDFNSLSDLSCYDEAQNRTSTCFDMQGTSGRIGYSSFHNLACIGTHVCLSNTRNVNLGGGEAGTDWNRYTDITVVNGNYGIYTNGGSGTGNVYSDMNLVTFLVGIMFNGANGTNIGDITLANMQFGGDGDAFIFSGTGAYRSRITVANVQCDAGVNRCVVATNYSYMSLIGVTLGGGVVNSLPGKLNFYCGSKLC